MCIHSMFWDSLLHRVVEFFDVDIQVIQLWNYRQVRTQSKFRKEMTPNIMSSLKRIALIIFTALKTGYCLFHLFRGKTSVTLLRSILSRKVVCKLRMFQDYFRNCRKRLCLFLTRYSCYWFLQL